MSFIPKPHEIYKHFKGNLYQITAIAEHSETAEQLVIYQAMYGEFKTYARPLAMFLDKVDKEKYPDVEQVFRFELQGANAEESRKERLSELGIQATDNQASNAEQHILNTESQSSDTVSLLESTAQDEQALDPLVMEFLDADSYERRLNIMAALHHRITNEMITTMAIACDVEIEDASIEERYESLKSCLLTLNKYECSRIR